jgi:hypothetical protein
MAFVWTLVFIIGAQGLDGGSKGATAISLVGAAVMLVAVLVFSWSIFRLAQLAVFSSDEGIVVRNWFLNKTIPWADIKEFKFGTDLDHLSSRELISTPFLQSYAVTNNGQHVVMSGLQAIRLNRTESRRRVQTLLDQLEEERLSHLGQ